ncbi:hypothetical protein [Deinococcus sp.]|uniref:hypothetical protein n=1 Tax=Deinococcus sp. TaxID=47478 RepID=UPI003C7CE00E
MEEYFLVGQLPHLEGKILEEMIGQEYRFRQEKPDSPAQVFLFIGGVWYRVSADGPQLYWRIWDRAPEAWEVPEEGMYAPLRDLGHELGLKGQILEGYSYGIRNDSPSVSINFQDGRQITFFGTGDGFSAFEVVKWFLNS